MTQDVNSRLLSLWPPDTTQRAFILSCLRDFIVWLETMTLYAYKILSPSWKLILHLFCQPKGGSGFSTAEAVPEEASPKTTGGGLEDSASPLATQD